MIRKDLRRSVDVAVKEAQAQKRKVAELRAMDASCDTEIRILGVKLAKAAALLAICNRPDDPR